MKHIILATLVLMLLLRPSAACGDDTTFGSAFGSYSDTYNGFKIMIPVESAFQEKGYNTHWTGPMINGTAATIFVNTTEMRHVPMDVIYTSNLKSYRENRSYTNVVPLPAVKLGKTTVYAFRCTESNYKPGTNDSKDPSDIHRWHLFVYGNERAYSCTLACNFSAFQDHKVQATFDKVIQSFTLIPAK